MIFSLKSKIRGRGCWSLRLRCLWVPSCRAFSRARRTRCERGRARAVRRCRPHTNSGYDKLTRPARLRWQGYSCPRLLTPQTTFSSLEASATLRVESSLDTQGRQTALSLAPRPPHSSLYCPTSGIRMHHDALMHSRASGCEGTNAQRVAPSKVPPRRLHALRMFEGVLPRPRRQTVWSSDRLGPSPLRSPPREARDTSGPQTSRERSRFLFRHQHTRCVPQHTHRLTVHFPSGLQTACELEHRTALAEFLWM